MHDRKLGVKQCAKLFFQSILAGAESMAGRSLLLWEISSVLGRFGGEELRSVPELRSACPEIAKAYPKMGLVELEEIRDRLRKGEQITPAAKPDGRRRNRKSKLTDFLICELFEKGESQSSIAEVAGVSRARIGQILS
jgi:hypothetical protein